MQFKDSITFIKSFLKEPKKIMTAATIAGSIIVGAKKISAQELQFISPIDLNPAIYKDGHLFSSKTYGVGGDSTTASFLEQSFEYRYGRKFKGENQYNVALEVGKNNLLVNGKLVPEYTFARIHSTLYLSKLLKTPLDIKLGYSREISNFVLKDIRLLDKTSLTASVMSKNIGYGGSISIDQSKIKGFNGIIDVKIDSGNYSAGIRYTENLESKTKYYSIQGTAKMKDKGMIFMPLIQGGLSVKEGKSVPFINYAIYYAPNKRLEIYIHRNFSNMNQNGTYVELNYLLGKTKERKVLDFVKEKERKVKSVKESKKEDNFLKKLFGRKIKTNLLKRSKQYTGYPMVKKIKKPR